MEKDIYSFIVRIWQDAPGAESLESGWRGSIDLVGSGKRFYFQDLHGMVSFITEQTGGVYRSRLSIWQSFLRTVSRLVKPRRLARRR